MNTIKTYYVRFRDTMEKSQINTIKALVQSNTKRGAIKRAVYLLTNDCDSALQGFELYSIELVN